MKHECCNYCLEWKERAERAEAEVEQLNDLALDNEKDWSDERALADELAEALKFFVQWSDLQEDALAKWKEARRES